MQVIALPLEILRQVLIEAVRVRGLKRGLRLRLVCGLFNKEVETALFASGIIDLKIRTSRSAHLMSKYIYNQARSQKKIRPEYLDLILLVADCICYECQDESESAVQACVEKLCFLAATEGQADLSEVRFLDATLSSHFLAGAVYMNCVPLVKKLMAEGTVDVSEPSSLFGYPTKIAAMRAHNEILEILFSNSDDSMSQKVSWAIRGVADGGNLQTLETILKPRPSQRFNPLNDNLCLEYCTQGFYSKHVEVAIKAYAVFGRHVNCVDEYLPQILCSVVGKGYLETTLYFLEHGTYINGEFLSVPESYSNTLCTAAKNGHYDIVKMLLEKGANPNPRCRSKRDPLFMAARIGNLGIARLLLDYGADPNFGEPSPLACAIELEHSALFNLLRERGAKLESETVVGIALAEELTDGLGSMVDRFELFSLPDKGKAQLGKK